MNRTKQLAKRLLRKLGFDVTRYQPRTHALAKKSDLRRKLGIDLVLDVGANIGQFAEELRRDDYRGRIVSFEPLSAAFATLQDRAQRDPDWDALNIALGSSEGVQTIHVTEANWSSSLLPVSQLSVEAHPTTKIVASESIQVRRLDSVLPELQADGRKIWLKIDAQGFELEVLRGGVEALTQVSMLQLEMSFVHLYEGQPLFDEVYHWALSQGFRLGSLEGISWHPQNGELLWLDGVFHRVN
jgi:FkbM family methyltransferase